MAHEHLKLPKRPRVYTPDEWKDKRHAFTELYLHESSTLAKAMDLMAKKHNFYATEAQYKNKIRDWGLRKNREYKSKTGTRGKSSKFKLETKPTGVDERTGSLRKRHKGTSRNDPNKCLGDCEHIQTDFLVIPAHIERPTKPPIEAGCELKHNNAVASSVNLPRPDLCTGNFDVGLVQSVSFSESAASSSPLGPFNGNTIQEEHHIDTNESGYNNHYIQEEKQKLSDPILLMPPIIDEAVKPLAKNKDIGLSADIELHGASEGHKGMDRFILQKNTSLSREDWPSGETPLNKAAYCGSEDTIRILLLFGADVSSRGLDGETALHWAAVRNHKRAARLLLDKGIDLSPNSYGETALHLAAQYGHEEIVHLILRKDIDLSQQDEDGKTALDRAEYNNHEKIVCLLRRRDMLKTWMGDHDEQSGPSSAHDDPSTSNSKTLTTSYPPIDIISSCPDYLFSLWGP